MRCAVVNDGPLVAGLTDNIAGKSVSSIAALSAAVIGLVGSGRRWLSATGRNCRAVIVQAQVQPCGQQQQKKHHTATSPVPAVSTATPADGEVVRGVFPAAV